MKIGAVEGWGVRLRQNVAILEPGKKYTFAVLAKSLGEPVSLRLDVKRAFDPQGGQVAWAPPIIVGKDAWRELHVTFKINEPSPKGWSARVGCQQPDVEFRLASFRLYEGDYLASEQAAEPMERSGNLLENPSFERGTLFWTLGTGGNTKAQMSVDNADAADGRQSALVSIDDVSKSSVHLSQTIEAPAPGKVYTFSVLAKATKGPVPLGLIIWCAVPPFDEVVRSEMMTVAGNTWKELHVTFKPEQPCPEGWNVFVNCEQPKAEFRLDGFRLYEGRTENLLLNPNFELGKASWTLDAPENAIAQFTVDDAETVHGCNSARVKIGAVVGGGVRFSPERSDFGARQEVHLRCAGQESGRAGFLAHRCKACLRSTGGTSGLGPADNRRQGCVERVAHYFQDR